MRLALAPLLVVPVVLFCAGAVPAHAQQQKEAAPWIGVLIEPGPKGVLIKQAVAKTPAARAGLQAGDQVMSVDGVRVMKPQELVGTVQKKGVGESVSLIVLRGEKSLLFTLKLEPRPDELAFLRDQLVGKPAPAFALDDSKGPHPAKLEALRGHIVVVEFFATWCGPCTIAMPRINAWQQKYAARGLRVVAISMEPSDKVHKYAADKQPGYTLAVDPKGAVSGSYYVPAIPTFMVIDRDGKVVYANVGAGETLDEVEAVFVKLLAPAGKAK
jgi:peroxiredoxin